MAVACTAFINLRELTDQGISMERTSPTRLRMTCALACWRFAAAIPMATTSTGCVSTGALKHFIADGAIVYRQACALGCEGIVSKRMGSPYRSGRADCWLKVKNPAAPAVTRESEEEWN
jgi:hypothetical protein